MSRVTTACLCATNRPEWRPWLLHQYEKQTWPEKELILDDGEGSIPEKRTRLLRAAISGGYQRIAWFDDDDWQNPKRLEITEVARQSGRYDAVGNVASWMISVENGKAIRYQAPEGIIFNGAVFTTRAMPDTFSLALQTGEDTDWLMRWHRRKPSYVILSEPLSMWLCHRKNVTNRADARSYTETPPNLITEDEWRLVPR